MFTSQIGRDFFDTDVL